MKKPLSIILMLILLTAVTTARTAHIPETPISLNISGNEVSLVFEVIVFNADTQAESKTVNVLLTAINNCGTQYTVATFTVIVPSLSTQISHFTYSFPNDGCFCGHVIGEADAGKFGDAITNYQVCFF